MSEKPDGGFAFPSPIAADSMGGLNFSGSYPNTGGMSLRDYFAGQAVAGICAEVGSDVDDGVLARRCYEIADAMLKAQGQA